MPATASANASRFARTESIRETRGVAAFLRWCAAAIRCGRAPRPSRRARRRVPARTRRRAHRSQHPADPGAEFEQYRNRVERIGRRAVRQHQRLHPAHRPGHPDHRVECVDAGAGHPACRRLVGRIAPRRKHRRRHLVAEIGLDMEQAAEFAARGDAGQFLHRRKEALVGADAEHDPGVAAGGDGALGLGAGQGQRLFAEHRLSGSRRPRRSGRHASNAASPGRPRRCRGRRAPRRGWRPAPARAGRGSRACAPGRASRPSRSAAGRFCPVPRRPASVPSGRARQSPR